MPRDSAGKKNRQRPLREGRGLPVNKGRARSGDSERLSFPCPMLFLVPDDGLYGDVQAGTDAVEQVKRNGLPFVDAGERRRSGPDGPAQVLFRQVLVDQRLEQRLVKDGCERTRKGGGMMSKERKGGYVGAIRLEGTEVTAK